MNIVLLSKLQVLMSRRTGIGAQATTLWRKYLLSNKMWSHSTPRDNVDADSWTA